MEQAHLIRLFRIEKSRIAVVDAEVYLAHENARDASMTRSYASGSILEGSGLPVQRMNGAPGPDCRICRSTSRLISSG